MSNKCKLILIYLLMFIVTIILQSIFYTPWGCNHDGGFILICNTICLLALAKILKVDKNAITKFLFIISVLFIVLIVDKDIFYSNYVQCTPDSLMFPILSCILYIALLPFTMIFDMLYSLNLFDFSFIFIPAYFIATIFISRVILSYNRKKFNMDN